MKTKILVVEDEIDIKNLTKYRVIPIGTSTTTPVIK